MIEGVECLIQAELLQKWFYDNDVDGKGQTQFFLNDYYYDYETRQSPIPITSWNDYMESVEYRKICTFGRIIFIPFGKYILSIMPGPDGQFCKESNKYTKLKFSSFSLLKSIFSYFSFFSIF